MNPDVSVLKVRRSILINAPAPSVWRQFETKAAMDRLWGVLIGEPKAGAARGHVLDAFEPRCGARIEMAVFMDGRRVRFGGEIVVFDAGRELTFEDDWIPNQGWARPTYITLRLAAAPGGTLVEFFHHGFEHVGGDIAAEHAAYEAGWGMTQLVALKALVES
jgi:uncharacterized protein YndB with AHSA1/START domain